MVNTAHILTTNSLILENVMGYLPVVDLYQLQSICKFWKTCATRVIRMREKEQQSQLITITQDSHEDKFVTFKRTHREMSWDRNSHVYKHLLEWKNNWTSLPHTGICICHMENGQKKLNFETENMMRYWLPPGSKLLVLGSVHSVVCVEVDQTEKENDVDNLKAFYNFLSFPSKLGAYSVDFLHLHSSHVEKDHDDFIATMQQELDNVNTKMLFICERRFPDQFLPILHDSVLVPAVKKGIVVIGCMFDSPIVLSPDGSYSSFSVIGDSLQNLVVTSFKGKDVRAASVLVSAEVDTQLGLLEELKKLQDTVLDFSKDCPAKCGNRSSSGYCCACHSQTLGIMIACCYRANSCEWYDCEEPEMPIAITKNLEQKTFRQMIPNVPLLGTFGMGEIGASINLVGQNCDEDIDDLDLSESTVFAVVMLK